MSLVAEQQDIQLGFGGIGMEELRKMKLSISDAFDPCRNLRATATLLDGYYRLAVNAGADPKRAGQVMLQSAAIRPSVTWSSTTSRSARK